MSTPKINPGFYNIKDFGAKGERHIPDTEAINKAIETAASAGGGTIYFPAGEYLSFSIRLKSNVTLNFENGAILTAAVPDNEQGFYDYPEPNDFDMYQDFGHSHWHNSLIWGENLENIGITGSGLIVGDGLLTDDYQASGQANKAIALKSCRNVVLNDFTVVSGGHFCLLATGVDNLNISNITIDTNRDGIDIDCCHHVNISGCRINSPFDDSIVLKSSFGLGSVRLTEDVTIRNCFVSGFDKNNAARVPGRGGGRIKLGTESNGGFKNIRISHCVFEFSMGLALETVDGGILEDISISDITMKDVMGAPFFLRLGSRMRGPEDIMTGIFRRITIRNAVISSSDPDYASLLTGIPGFDIEDIKLKNISMLVKGGAPADQASLPVPEMESSYPDPQEFGKIPAYGFYIRHARNIKMSNVELKLERADARPAFILEDVKGISFINVSVAHVEGKPGFVLKNVTEFKSINCRDLNDKKIDKADNIKL